MLPLRAVARQRVFFISLRGLQAACGPSPTRDYNGKGGASIEIGWQLSKTAAPGFAPSRPWGAGFVKGNVSPLAASLLTGGEACPKQLSLPAGNERGPRKKRAASLIERPIRRNMIATRSRARSKPTTSPPNMERSNSLAAGGFRRETVLLACDLSSYPHFRRNYDVAKRVIFRAPEVR